MNIRHIFVCLQTQKEGEDKTMNHLKSLFMLLVAPGKTWQKMEKVPLGMQTYISRFLYPFMGMAALAALSQYFVADISLGKELSLARALQLAIVEFVKFFGGFYALAYILKFLFHNFWEVAIPESRIKYFVGQTLCLYMLLDIVLFVMQLFVTLPSVVEFLPLLLVYVIWNSQKYMEITEQKGLIYVVITTILFLAVPLTIQKILEILMPTI